MPPAASRVALAFFACYCGHSRRWRARPGSLEDVRIAGQLRARRQAATIAARCASSVPRIHWRATSAGGQTKAPVQGLDRGYSRWLRGEDLNLCPSGYEPDELP